MNGFLIKFCPFLSSSLSTSYLQLLENFWKRACHTEPKIFQFFPVIKKWLQKPRNTQDQYFKEKTKVGIKHAAKGRVP